jgi:hypothetical protein
MILGILLGESYRSICAFADLSVCVNKTNKLFGAVTGETVAELILSLA